MKICEKSYFLTRAKDCVKFINRIQTLLKKELKDFKKLYEIEHKEIDVSDFIPIPLKWKKEYATKNVQIHENTIGEILLKGDEKFEEHEEDQNMDEEHSDEEEKGSDEKERYKFFIFRGFIKQYRFFMQL